MQHSIIAHSDHGTVLEANQAALIAGPDGALSLLLPEMEDDAPVSPMVQLLVSVALLSEDEEWVSETLAALERRRDQ